MKIAMIRLDLTLENGDNRMFFSLAQTIRKLGHQVSVYTAQFDQDCFLELNKGLAIRVITPKKKLEPIVEISSVNPFLLLVKIWARLRNNALYADAAQRIGRLMEKNFEVVLAQNDHSYQLGPAYKKFSPQSRFVWIMNNAPFYHLPKDNLLIDFLSQVWAFFRKQTVKKYAAGLDLIVVNDQGRQEIVRKVLGRPVKLLRIAVDFQSFFQKVKERKAGDKKVVLLGMGSLSPERRFEDIIKAAGNLRREGYEARVVLVCKDLAGQGNYQKILVKLAEQEGLAGFTDFRFEGATEEELRQLQQRSDIFIFPSRIDIWGMAAFEAMAAGLPLIASRVTSVAEVLKEGEEALFVEPAQPAALAEKIKELINQPKFYKKIALAGQEFVKVNLSWEKYARELLSAVEKLQ